MWSSLLTTGSPSPGPRYGATSQQLSDEVYVFGGSNVALQQNGLHVLNLETVQLQVHVAE